MHDHRRPLDQKPKYLQFTLAWKRDAVWTPHCGGPPLEALQSLPWKAWMHLDHGLRPIGGEVKKRLITGEDEAIKRIAWHAH